MTSIVQRLSTFASAVTVAAAWLAIPSHAQGDLTLYCSPQIEWCEAMITAFQKETGIKVAMTRKSSVETYAQVKAEASNPKGDLWWGGTGDPHLQAAEEGLTEEYKSPLLEQLHDWARKQAEQSGYKTVGVYAGALGFGDKTELLAKKGLPEPKCWADSTKPEYKLARYRPPIRIRRGTAYTALATFVQMRGRGKGFRVTRRRFTRMSTSTPSPGPSTDQGRGPGRDDHRHHSPPRHRHAGCLGCAGEVGIAVRGDGLRDWLDEHYQWLPQPGQRQEMV